MFYMGQYSTQKWVSIERKSTLKPSILWFWDFNFIVFGLMARKLVISYKLMLKLIL